MEISQETQRGIGHLIHLASEGDAECLDTLLKRYRPYLHVLAEQGIRRLFNQKFDASDAVQQTCLEAFEGMESFRGTGEREFNAWIVRILEHNIANLMRDHTAQKRDVRRERRLTTQDTEITLHWIEPATPNSGPQSHIIHGEAALLLAQALAQLTRGQSTAVQMRFLEGRRLVEIADYMEITPASVARMIDRGLESLRRLLPGGLDESR